MQSLWSPPPVFVLFRRIVNAFSAFSVSQHYLLQRTSPPPPPEANARNRTSEAYNVLRPFSWLGWLSRDQAAFSLAAETVSQSHEPLGDPPPPTYRRRTIRKRSSDPIHRLLHNPVLYEPVRAPRNPVVLCHGLYGFDVRGPAAFPMLRQHYWSNVLAILRQKIGAEVLVTSVPGTGSIASRARSLHQLLRGRASGKSINFIAHSMGGLDCRHLITHLKPTEYQPTSLTTIATPHRGSPFMDWCTDNIGIGKLRKKELEIEELVRDVTGRARQHEHKGDPPNASSNSSKSSFPLSLASLPSSFTTLLLGLLDSPAYANLSTAYLNNVFNPHTPDDPRVRYFSVAGRISSMNIWHPLWLPKLVLDGFEARERERLGDRWEPSDGGEVWGNDGLVTVQSARWGEFLGIMEECDHWELRGARGIELDLWGGKEGSTSNGNGNGNGNGSSSTNGDGNGSDEGWNLGDWGRFVRAWKSEEKKARQAGAAVSEQLESASHDRMQSLSQSQSNAAGTSHSHSVSSASASAEDRAKEHGFVDDVVKASTDKVSAIFDWIVEQVPSRSGDFEAAAKAESRQEAKKVAEKSDLATKADLERFYVALCRKLYEEGL